MTTKISLFKANYGQDPRIAFERREKRKYKAAGKFVKRMRKIQKEVKTALEKTQKEMRKYANRRREESKEYKGLKVADGWKKIGKVN